MTWNATVAPQAWAVLTGALRLRPMALRDRQRSVRARALTDDDTCIQLLDQLGPIIGSPTPAITASLLAKRFSFLTTGVCLYAMSVCDQAVLLTLDDCVVEYGHDDGVWTSCLPLEDQHFVTFGPDGRDEWRIAVVQALFAGLLAPLWQTFYRVSGISRRILWENTAVRVYSLYEKRMNLVEDPHVRLRHEEDFRWLLQDAPPALFGLDYNPLAHFHLPLTEIQGATGKRFRRTCCFYYQACDPVEFCSTCPLTRPKPLRKKKVL